MKGWRIIKFCVEEIEYENSDGNNGNTYNTKEEAYTKAILSLNERVNENLDYLERLREQIAGQEEVLKYYLLKRNKLIQEVKSDNIEMDDFLL